MFERLEPRLLLTTLPAGFSEAQVTTGLNSATAMELSPTGELWVLEQAGGVNLVRGDGTRHTAINLVVNSGGERGLLGIAFDSAYDGAGPNTDYVFLYYTATTPETHNRVSRFTITGAGTDMPTLGSESIILEIEPEAQGDNSSNHNGGAIHFGLDGKLYIAIGDHNADGVNFQGANHVSQSLAYRHGKILRINPDGTNPSDNPFYTGSDPIADAIWALGLRNPYTFAIEPGTGNVFINDVGERNWEEINEGVAGANYGWASEGTPGGFGEGFETSAPSYVTIGAYTNPVMAFDHSGSAPTPFGCAITGGVFYPAGGQFGPAYDGVYFFADFCGDFIRVFDPANPGSTGTPDTSTGFASNVTGTSPVDLKVDADGNLYFLTRGSVYRISANAPFITDQPDDVTVDEGQQATFTVEATGEEPLIYQWQMLIDSTWTNVSGANSDTFTIASTTTDDAGQYRVFIANSSGSATSDAVTLTVNVVGEAPSITQQPGDQMVNVGDATGFTVVATGDLPISYQWQMFDGAWNDVTGATSASYNIASAGVADDGQYRVVVANAFGSATSNTVTLMVNQLPSAVITADTPYTFGDTINFSATANDPEDGSLSGSAFSWTIEFGHDAHFHPHVAQFGGVTGDSFIADFIEPDPDHYYRILLTVTDSKGASFDAFFDVLPVNVNLTLDTSPIAIPLTIDGQPVAGPFVSVAGTVRAIQAPPSHVIDSTTYLFDNWSDGGAATHSITTPSVDTTYTASYIIAQPDLVATSFDSTDHVLRGQADVTYTIENVGNLVAVASTAEIVLSDDAAIATGDELIITVNIPDLDPGEFFTDTIAIQLPLATLNARALADDPPGQGGNHQSTSFDILGIIVDAGDDNAESNEANNLDQGNGIDKDDVTYFPWDIDGNGVITPTDAIFFINRLGQNVPPADGRADPDGSGDVTPTDAIAAINRLTYLRNDGVIDADPIAPLNSGVSAANEFSALLIDAHQVANNRSRGRIGQWLDSDDDEPVFDVFDQFT